MLQQNDFESNTLFACHHHHHPPPTTHHPPPTTHHPPPTTHHPPPTTHHPPPTTHHPPPTTHHPPPPPPPPRKQHIFTTYITSSRTYPYRCCDLFGGLFFQIPQTDTAARAARVLGRVRALRSPFARRNLPGLVAAAIQAPGDTSGWEASARRGTP